MDKNKETDFLESVKKIHSVIGATIEYLPDINKLKGIGKNILKRTNPIINIYDSYEEYQRSGMLKNGIARFVANTTSGAITAVIVVGGANSGQIELFVVAFVFGDVSQKTIEEISIQFLEFVDSSLISPVYSKIQQVLKEIFIYPLEKFLNYKLFKQGFYEEYDPNNTSDTIEFLCDLYSDDSNNNIGNNTYEYSHSNKYDITTISYHTSQQTKSIHNNTINQTIEHCDSKLKSIKQDFFDYKPIDVLSRNGNRFFIRLKKTNNFPNTNFTQTTINSHSPNPYKQHYSPQTHHQRL